jgi:hypothetical protein
LENREGRYLPPGGLAAASRLASISFALHSPSVMRPRRAACCRAGPFMRSKKAESWTISCPDRSVHQDLSPDGPIKGVGPFILAKSQVVRSDGISRQEGLGSIFRTKVRLFWCGGCAPRIPTRRILALSESVVKRLSKPLRTSALRAVRCYSSSPLANSP